MQTSFLRPPPGYGSWPCLNIYCSTDASGCWASSAPCVSTPSRPWPASCPWPLPAIVPSRRRCGSRPAPFCLPAGVAAAVPHQPRAARGELRPRRRRCRGHAGLRRAHYAAASWRALRVARWAARTAASDHRSGSGRFLRPLRHMHGRLRLQADDADQHQRGDRIHALLPVVDDCGHSPRPHRHHRRQHLARPARGGHASRAPGLLGERRRLAVHRADVCPRSAQPHLAQRLRQLHDRQGRQRPSPRQLCRPPRRASTRH